jgi:hypothetical protein
LCLYQASDVVIIEEAKMSRRRKKAQRGSKQDKKRRQKSSNNALSNLKVEKRASIISIPVTVKTDGATPDIRPTSLTYEIVHPDTGLAVAAHISHETLAKISAANGLLHFGFKNPSLRENPSSTWPHQWQYLSEAQLEELEKSGLPVLSQKYILIESLQIRSFGKGLYYSQRIETFFESWVEIIWQEYVVEQELRRYQDLHRHGQPVVTIDQPGEINLQNAETWIPLENCAVRIRSMWERLHKYIIPLYFAGNIALDKADRAFWRGLDAGARRLLNKEQLPFYEKLYQSILDIENSSLKNLRDDLIHRLSPRPTGVIPASVPAPSLPRTVKELYQLVQAERSRVREALVLMSAIIRAKTPANREITEAFP